MLNLSLEAFFFTLYVKILKSVLAPIFVNKCDFDISEVFDINRLL